MSIESRAKFRLDLGTSIKWSRLHKPNFIYAAVLFSVLAAYFYFDGIFWHGGVKDILVNVIGLAFLCVCSTNLATFLAGWILDLKGNISITVDCDLLAIKQSNVFNSKEQTFSIKDIVKFYISKREFVAEMIDGKNVILFSNWEGGDASESALDSLYSLKGGEGKVRNLAFEKTWSSAKNKLMQNLIVFSLLGFGYSVSYSFDNYRDFVKIPDRYKCSAEIEKSLKNTNRVVENYVEESFKKNVGGILACYENLRAKHPNFEGKLVVGWENGVRGSLCFMRESALVTESMYNCVFLEISEWKFKFPRSHRGKIVRYDLDFSRK